MAGLVIVEVDLAVVLGGVLASVKARGGVVSAVTLVTMISVTAATIVLT